MTDQAGKIGPTIGPADAARRDFLLTAAGALTAVGALATAWPFINFLNPAADVLAAGAP
ncbi:MAG TPA: ubiquinol-cytochrome c reductase iron-sulfur subunit N-terminal domain-containing protein, partial [Reyranella sp.]|nr:ubiquinol-cytochrome c reductase iron-sulfur subunit N-terminal domain-containing protein [Reyranella sp.]